MYVLSPLSACPFYAYNIQNGRYTLNSRPITGDAELNNFFTYIYNEKWLWGKLEVDFFSDTLYQDVGMEQI